MLAAATAYASTGQPSPQPDALTVLEKYTVNYRGGLPAYPTSHSGGIDFVVTPDAFVLRPQLGSKSWFAGLTIPFASVTSFEIAQRQVSTFEGILGGLDSRQLNQANNIHIGLRADGQDLVLRLEMISGLFVMAQAGKCLELMDHLRARGILKKFAGSQAIEKPKVTIDSPKPAPDAIDQITRLAALRDQGILSNEEFEAKKAELLSRQGAGDSFEGVLWSLGTSPSSRGRTRAGGTRAVSSVLRRAQERVHPPDGLGNS